MCMRRYNGVNFNPIAVPQATPPIAGMAAADTIELYKDGGRRSRSAQTSILLDS